jgi:hypothetical protein
LSFKDQRRGEPDPNLPKSQRTITAYFKVSCLANPRLVKWARRNRDDSGQRYQPVEFGIHEEVPSHGHYLQFRAEFFNLFNHPQFDDPSVYPGNNPQAGKITSASDYGYNF